MWLIAARLIQALDASGIPRRQRGGVMLTDEERQEILLRIEKRYEESGGKRFTEEQRRSVIEQIEAGRAGEGGWRVVIPNTKAE